MIPKKIIIHCSATPNGQSVDIETIRKDHIQNRGFTDIGYHMLINVDGTCQNGRPLNVVGAHCEGENHDAIGICLVGTDKYTYKQFETLRYKLDSIIMTYSIPRFAIWCHYEFASAKKQGKTCPNLRDVDLLYWYIVEDDVAIKKYVL